MDNFGQLLIALQKAHRAAIAARLTEIGLYPGQDGLLYHLSQHEGLTITELMGKLNVTLPTLSNMVTRMETEGLLKKNKDLSDKRTSRIFLTAKGKKRLAELAAIWKDLEKQLLTGFGKEDKDRTKALLGRLLHNLKTG